MRLAVFLICTTCQLNAAQATVTVFHHNQELQLESTASSPSLLAASLSQIFPSLNPSPQTEDNKSPLEMERELFLLLSAHRNLLSLDKLSVNSVTLNQAELSGPFPTLRYQQKFDHFPLAGAELIAVYGAIHGNTLQTINSSLLNPLKLNTTYYNSNVTLSEEEAFEKAARELQFENAESGVIDGPKLLAYIDESAGAGEVILVHKLALRESENGANPTEVLIAASGPRAGQIVRALPFEASALPDSSIVIYDAGLTLLSPNPVYKGLKVLVNGKRRAFGWVGGRLREPKKANRTFTQVRDYYRNVFSRESYDNKGAPIRAAVNTYRYLKILDLLRMRENASWIPPWKIFSLGAGSPRLSGFSEAIDIVGHEFTHAVISTSSGLENVKQSGALAEHLADVFGMAIKNQYYPESDRFLFGDSCLRGPFAREFKAMRDLKNPHKSIGGQPAHMLEILDKYGPTCIPNRGNDQCGIHNIMGVPNRAIAIMVESLGWDTVARLIYPVMTTRLRSTSDFVDYRNQVLDHCTRSQAEAVCTTVKSAFNTVGL